LALYAQLERKRLLRPQQSLLPLTLSRLSNSCIKKQGLYKLAIVLFFNLLQGVIMKKYLMYLAIALLVVIVAFFAYKKIYGFGFYAEKQQNALLATAPATESTNTGGESTKSGMFE
jgi:hypothetical protein